jgi:zinc transport system substrate-binding protein
MENNMSKCKAAVIAAVIITLVFGLSGCRKSGNVSENTYKNGNVKETTIVTSFYPMFIFTQNITAGVPGVDVVNMTQPQTGCLHDYQLSPSDIKLLEKAQIFVINGAGLENFMDKLTGQLTELKIAEASKGIELLKEKDGSTDSAAVSNPHVWVSISGAILEVKNIGRQLAELDPANADQYLSNTEAYVKKLEAQKIKMHEELKDLKYRDIVTFHEAFSYFAKEFNLNVAAVIEREPGVEPSAGELADTVDRIKSLNVKALFAEPQYSSKAAETIARETGAMVYYLDPIVTGTVNADPDSYIRIMDENLKTLVKALG